MLSQIKPEAYEKYEHGDLGDWYIKLTNQRFLHWNYILKERKGIWQNPALCDKSILNIGCWNSSFMWKCSVLHSITFSWNSFLQSSK